MIVEQRSWRGSWSDTKIDNSKVNLLLLFGDCEYFKTKQMFDEVRDIYPNAIIVGCSTSGSIIGDNISDNDIIATAIIFEKDISLKVITIDDMDEDLIINEAIKLKDSKHTFVLSCGLISGDVIAKSFNKAGVVISGGLAGDGTRFGNTYVIANDIAKQNRIVAIGFYGDDLIIKTGCYAGWDEFGPEKIITKAENNIIYEIDNEPALTLYRRYLGDEAVNLPSSGLRFPINIRENESERPIIRALLNINNSDNSIILAGDAPVGYFAKFMKTNIDNLIDNAILAAQDAKFETTENNHLTIAVSCIGRRIVLGQIVEEELEVVADTLKGYMTGFYSYGELAPFHNTTVCKLHNETITLTTIYEL